MANPLSAKQSKTLLLGVLVIGLALGAVWWWRRTWLIPAVITLLSVVVLWILVELGAKLWRQKRQRGFDEKVAAKEGIEDRKREWASWSNELRKQGIDKSTLPFYLLVGEPQSGKSVLLQNSDLRFPFGQNRLSGIGGTRGCDWWFTDEAVILDLAGRLFTHEGGRADEEEWEAFLSILSDYRPLCPADGVILILPCDALLKDSESETTLKANRIQHSLLTLINKLQARLPVYVVLTKADKIFGFAETVHRLEASKRHEMFGWSREGDNYERAFELHEAHTGFESMIERARELRSWMLSSARIPEALPEVDRMYAFPDEMEALQPALETYLRIIFSECSLVDRLFFRGLYLTSGLQTGAPIAKVCRDMLGGGGEADQRDLEGLFTKQRAYFIKDFVRKRVFSERGLVQPTGRRVAQSQRNASIGYGAAALIALASIVASGVYLSRQKSETADDLYSSATASVQRNLDGSHSAAELLDSLSWLDRAIAVEAEGVEHLVSGPREEFKRLYVQLFDRVLVPELRSEAERTLLAKLEGEPSSYDEFLRWNDQLQLLLGGFNLDNDPDRRAIGEILGEASLRPVGDSGQEYDLRAAVRTRRESGASLQDSRVAQEDFSPELISSLDRMEKLWEGAITPGKAWQVRGELGFLIAWQGLTRSQHRLEEYQVNVSSDMHATAADYADSLRLLRYCLEPLPDADSPDGSAKKSKLSQRAYGDQLESLKASVKKLLETAGRSAQQWNELDFEALAASRFPKSGGGLKLPSGGAAGVVKDAAKRGMEEDKDFLLVPTTELDSAFANQLLMDFSEASFLPKEGWTAARLEADLTSAVARLAEKRLSKQVEAQALALAEKVVVGKLLELRGEYRRRFPDPETLSTELEPGKAGELQRALIEHLTRLGEGLRSLHVDYLDEWIRSIDAMLLEHLIAHLEAWKAAPQTARTQMPPGPDWKMIAALHEVERLQKTDNSLARMASDWSESMYLRMHDLIEYWSRLQNSREGQSPEKTNEIVELLGKQFTELGGIVGTSASTGARAHETSMLREADRMLEKRLARHVEEVRSNWRSKPEQDWLAFGDAVREVRDWLKEDDLTARGKRDGRLEARGLKRTPIEHLVAAPTNAQGAQPRLPESSHQLDALSALEFGSATLLYDSDYVRELRNFVDHFRDDDRVLGTKDVDVYLQRMRSEGGPELPRGAGGFFLKDVSDNFEARILRELRQQYLAELAKLLETDFTELLDELFLREPETLREDHSQARERDLDALLAREGRLALLRAKYRAEDPDMILRPLELEESEPWTPEWRLEKFLVELQRFLRDDKESMREASIKVTVLPDANRAGTVWADRKFLFVHDRIGGASPWTPHPRGGSSLLKFEGKWTIPGSHRFELRWSGFASPPSPTVENDEASLLIYSPLAPYLLAWSGTKSGSGWDVDPRVRGSDLSAPFRISFSNPGLPDRPEKNPFDN